MQEMENFRIRKAEFLNQNSLLGRHATKIFFTPGRKFVFQQYRPIAEVNSAILLLCRILWHHSAITVLDHGVRAVSTPGGFRVPLALIVLVLD